MLLFYNIRFFLYTSFSDILYTNEMLKPEAKFGCMWFFSFCPVRYAHFSYAHEQNISAWMGMNISKYADQTASLITNQIFTFIQLFIRSFSQILHFYFAMFHISVDTQSQHCWACTKYCTEASRWSFYVDGLFWMLECKLG